MSSTTLCGQRFVRGGVHVQTPTFKRVGDRGPGKCVAAACVRFEGWPDIVNAKPSKTRPQPAVEGGFECWRLTVNSTTSNTRPHRAVELPFPARRGGRGVGGESGGCSARIATSLIAAYAGPAKVGGSKPLQRPCGNRLQKFQSLVHSPPSPPPPLHPRRGEQVSSTALCGQRCVWGGVLAQRPTFKLAGNHVSLGRHGCCLCSL